MVNSLGSLVLKCGNDYFTYCSKCCAPIVIPSTFADKLLTKDIHSGMRSTRKVLVV